MRRMDIAGYTITRCIAQGGMAAAYLAEQKSLARAVVLKVLDTRTNTSPVALQRFLSEGRLLAALQHPHVITLYDIGAVDDFAYLSMEYVPGGDLKERLGAGPLAPEEALTILEQVARGLGAAHARGIVHRDVKPGNILFRADGTAVLSDFGIAKSLTGNTNVTSSGAFVGSPNYMAPEQARQVEIDHRVDIYALGVIFHEMLTGRKPYAADSIVEVIHRHAHALLPRLPADLALFQELLDRMLAKDRTQRFGDVPALLHSLASTRSAWRLHLAQGQGEPLHGRPVRVTQPAVGVPRERRLRRWLHGVLALTLCAHAVLYVLGERLMAPSSPLPATASNSPSDPGSPQQLAAVQALLVQAPPAQLRQGDELERAGMIKALLWLAAQALAEGRLTLPAPGSALYYYARALQLDARNLAAARGIAAIAARYGQLAEHATRAGDSVLAEAYRRLARRIEGMAG
ncbi:MAG: serine/threonine protein kinase [Gammaproteobacteria bacterium]|nr:serine/threonine protein kinase [Gammaproteobacteria bacterium]